MKTNNIECHHNWEDMYLFKDQHGDRYIQQRCRKCKENRYIALKEQPTENDQNGSNSEITHE